MTAELIEELRVWCEEYEADNDMKELRHQCYDNPEKLAFYAAAKAYLAHWG